MYAFGSFELRPNEQGLFDQGRRVALGGRAFALLRLLVERAGELVTKDALIAALWPDTTVEECNLRSQLSALRRALGCGRTGQRYILTVAGRGYRFVAPVLRVEAPFAGQKSTRGDLPSRLTSIVGREEDIARVRAHLTKHRLITITGAGGLGKTTVAVEAARGMVDDYPNGVHLVDFGPVGDEALVPSHVAATLGFANLEEDPTERLAAALHDRRLLLVFDGCEHVLTAVAALAERVLNGAPLVDLLVTSREPLRAEGEGVIRLPALTVPGKAEALAQNGVHRFSAVRLFVERSALAQVKSLEETIDLGLVAQICRRMDGNALAIEIAAGQLDTLGLEGLAGELGDHFVLMMKGRRTAHRRHQSLNATLDWSYRLLPPEEQWLLRQLSVSVEALSLPACAAIAGPGLEPAVIADLVFNLVTKSLIAAEAGPAGTRFRLLDVTRAYAITRLREADELANALERLAGHVLEVLTGPDQQCFKIASNLRIVLDWAHSPEGDARTALNLTMAAIPYWFSIGLLEECRFRTEQGLELARGMPSVERSVLHLHAGLAGVLVNTKGAGAQLAATANEIMIRAEELGDTASTLLALWAQWVERTNSGMHADALSVARQFAETALGQSDPSYPFAAHRMLGISLHYTGDQQRALGHLDQVLAEFNVPERSARNLPFQFDQRVSALCYRARTLLVMGLDDEAASVVAASVEEAQGLGHPPSLAYALCEGALPISICLGDIEKVAFYVRLALACTRNPGLELWQKIAQSCAEWLHMRDSSSADGGPALKKALQAMRSVRLDPIYTVALGRFAERLGRSGAVGEGLEVIQQAIARADQGGELWCRAELLRIKANLLHRKDDAQSRSQSLALLREARDEARTRGEICWQRRITKSLARLEGSGNEPASVAYATSPAGPEEAAGAPSVPLRAPFMTDDFSKPVERFQSLNYGG